jgi:hypothetical protein
MPAWKVLFILVLACACLGLAFASLIVAMSQIAGANHWLWLVGLLGGTAFMGALLALFLRRASSFMQPFQRGR